MTEWERRYRRERRRRRAVERRLARVMASPRVRAALFVDGMEILVADGTARRVLAAGDDAAAGLLLGRLAREQLGLSVRTAPSGS